MKVTLLKISAAVVFLTAVLLALIVAVPSRRALFVGIYELVLAAIAVSALVSSFRTLAPQAWLRSPFERDPAKPEEPPPIAAESCPGRRPSFRLVRNAQGHCGLCANSARFGL